MDYEKLYRNEAVFECLRASYTENLLLKRLLTILLPPLFPRLVLADVSIKIQ